MPSFSIHDLKLVMLNPSIPSKAFDCGDADLNAFLRNDSIPYSQKLLAKTYVALHGEEIVGYFSICADAIRLSKEERVEQFGVSKSHPDYPAVKIARLAVASKHSRQGIGTFLVTEAVGKAIEMSQVLGCRFMAVDAYEGQAAFYEKQCNFIRNRSDGGGQNVSMRLDLLDLQ